MNVPDIVTYARKLDKDLKSKKLKVEDKFPKLAHILV